MREHQLSIDFTADMYRSRASDPLTSHEAAHTSKRFAGGHAATILAALKQHGPLSPKRLFDFTGLTVVQIDRRLPEMKRKQLAAPTGKTDGGCRVWEAV